MGWMQFVADAGSSCWGNAGKPCRRWTSPASTRWSPTNSGEIEASGIDVRAGASRETSWGELELDAYWSHDLDYEYEVLGHAQPVRRPRNRLSIAASVERGDVSATWNLLARSGLDEEHSRFGGWVGHDLLFQWVSTDSP